MKTVIPYWLCRMREKRGYSDNYVARYLGISVKEAKSEFSKWQKHIKKVRVKRNDFQNGK